MNVSHNWLLSVLRFRVLVDSIATSDGRRRAFSALFHTMSYSKEVSEEGTVETKLHVFLVYTHTTHPEQSRAVVVFPFYWDLRKHTVRSDGAIQKRTTVTHFHIWPVFGIKRVTGHLTKGYVEYLNPPVMLDSCLSLSLSLYACFFFSLSPIRSG